MADTAENGNSPKAPSTSNDAGDGDAHMSDASSTSKAGSSRKPRRAAAARKSIVEEQQASADDDSDASFSSVSDKPVKRKLTKKEEKKLEDKSGNLYCHQDHTGHDPSKEVLLRCTGSKPVSTKPGAAHKNCILMYCEKCLQKHYEEDARKIIADGDQDKWKCPSCRNMCSCSVCRRKSALAAGLPPPTKRAPPGQGKSHHGSRAGEVARKRRRRSGRNSDSETEDSDEEHIPAGKAAKAAAKPKPVKDANYKRASPPPRPPKTVEPPKTFPLAGVHPTPATTSILARLHLRAFIIRFLPLMPSLKGNGMKVTQVLTYLSDDLIWIWSRRDAELAQRYLLKALLELIQDEPESDILDELESRRLMVQLVDKDMKKAMTTSSREEMLKPWSTLKEIVEKEEVWADPWGARAVEWEVEREETEGPESELRGRKGEMGPDEKLALLCALIELAYGAEGLRTNINEGVEAEKSTMVSLNKKKFKQRHDWLETRASIMAKKPPKPTAPTKGTTLVSLAEEWRAEVQAIDAEVVEAEKESQKETFEIQRMIYLTQSANRVRFSAAGKDARGNTYYLLSPCHLSPFPVNSTLGTNADFPLSWTIIVHGKPFKLDPIDQELPPGSRAKAAKKVKAEDAEEKPAPVAVGSLEERELSRGRNGDAWFLVDPINEGDLLIEYIEFGAKYVSYDRKKAAYDRAKDGKPAVEDKPDPREDQNDLLNHIRIFVEYVKAAKELAKAEQKEKTKAKSTSAGGAKDKSYVEDSQDEDELDASGEDERDELDSD